VVRQFGFSGSSAALKKSLMARASALAKANNPFWSNHVAAWYRRALRRARHLLGRSDDFTI
jgi:hypothetical protein